MAFLSLPETHDRLSEQSSGQNSHRSPKAKSKKSKIRRYFAAGLLQSSVDYIHTYIMALAALFLGFFSGVFGGLNDLSGQQITQTQSNQSIFEPSEERTASAYRVTRFCFWWSCPYKCKATQGYAGQDKACWS